MRCGLVYTYTLYWTSQGQLKSITTTTRTTKRFSNSFDIFCIMPKINWNFARRVLSVFSSSLLLACGWMCVAHNVQEGETIICQVSTFSSQRSCFFLLTKKQQPKRNVALQNVHMNKEPLWTLNVLLIRFVSSCQSVSHHHKGIQSPLFALWLLLFQVLHSQLLSIFLLINVFGSFLMFVFFLFLFIGSY